MPRPRGPYQRKFCWMFEPSLWIFSFLKKFYTYPKDRSVSFITFTAFVTYYFVSVWPFWAEFELRFSKIQDGTGCVFISLSLFSEIFGVYTGLRYG